MALTIAFASLKGGVGKSSAAVNIAALAAAGGARTLLWDVDPQGAATYTLRVGSRVPGGARRLVRKKPGAAAGVTRTAWPGLDVLPADFSLRNLDLELSARSHPRRRMREALRPVADDYDVVIIDCPSGVGLGIESALNATDLVVVPIVPSTLPLRSFEQFAAYLAADTRLQRVRVRAFLSMVDRRKKGHRLLSERLTNSTKPILCTTIPMSVHVENMADRRSPLVVDSGRNAAAVAYRDLWDELQSVPKRKRR